MFLCMRSTLITQIKPNQAKYPLKQPAGSTHEDRRSDIGQDTVRQWHCQHLRHLRDLKGITTTTTTTTTTKMMLTAIDVLLDGKGSGDLTAKEETAL